MAERTLIAGFDAGQTHTTCRLALLKPGAPPEPLAEGSGPGVSHLAAPDGEERFRRALAASLQQARRQHPASAQSPVPALTAAAVGASGIEHGSAVQRLGARLAAEALDLPLERVHVTGDERTALRGAFGERAGIVVISGTGCIALGRDDQGREHRCGGWGWLLDRGGSACDIGRDALSLALEMADGRRPPTALWEVLWRALLGKDSAGEPDLAPQRIKALVVEPGFGAAGFARLAPAVEGLAAAGDIGAQKVLESSARALAELVRGVARALELSSPEVCGLGGALGHLPVFKAAYRQALAAALPGARSVAPAGDACRGALDLAAQVVAGTSGLSRG